MNNVEDIEKAVEQLSPEEPARFRAWLAGAKVTADCG
jgi:hypothetical protein